ncbi:glycerophosphoryl diester phosphodiesterase [Lachnotalea glycerini]|uniref:Glycerophosphodiester phosphodiesterase n=1 Tax=Lachnotalea glycerini TaxID=1763509 RepID=A0A255I4C3_9FIRM|nr:glycerophosphodiester phosphodiesterase [Lachnotalea glycerini]PXV93703.1 glycerophosphoryl diester phosphodiesterase [Lachnotalea glycerini]RDY32648.1 glycerophosphodiester phosphodiesterase [Lachnotalea glycerini]
MTTKVWAHRGASGYAPENTLRAFEVAIEQKADGVELDIQLTKDGKVIVIHDEKLNRVTNGKGFVKNYTLQELKKLHCKNVFTEEQNITLPTLDEVFELIEPTDLTINIELKTGVFQYPGIEEKAFQTVKKWNMQDRVIYSSFYHPSILIIKEMDSQARVGLLYSDGFLDVAEYANRLGIKALHPPIWRAIDKNFVKQCKDYGIALHVWYADEEEHMKYLVDNKIEAIITNYPDRARNIIASGC